MALAGLGRIEPGEDHRQLRRRDGHARIIRGGERERAAFEPAEVKGEAVAHPGENLDLVARRVLKTNRSPDCETLRRTVRAAPASESLALRPSTDSTPTRMRPPGNRLSMRQPPRRRPVG